MNGTANSDHDTRDPVTHRIIGAFFSVYRELGWGFLERVYQRAMVVALVDEGAHVAREVALPIYVRGRLVGDYKADLLVDNEVLVEIKAVGKLTTAHRAQLLNYLKATNVERGLLMNFGPVPHFERLLFTNDRKSPLHSRRFPQSRS